MGKEYNRLYTLTCLFNFYAGYIIHSEGLDDSLAGIKIAGRNINNFRYAHDTILMAESYRRVKKMA